MNSNSPNWRTVTPEMRERTCICIWKFKLYFFKLDNFDYSIWCSIPKCYTYIAGAKSLWPTDFTPFQIIISQTQICIYYKMYRRVYSNSLFFCKECLKFICCTLKSLLCNFWSSFYLTISLNWRCTLIKINANIILHHDS